MQKVRDLTQNLRSGKIAGRSEGINNVRIVFSNPHVMQDMKQHGWREWKEVFEALFTCARTDRDMMRTKSAKAASKRLEGAISALRWLIEQHVKLLHYKALKCIFEHTKAILIREDESYHPVTLDCIKILRCILSWPPHLNFLAPETWIELVQLGFNVLFQDPLSVRLTGADWKHFGEPKPQSNNADDENYEDAPTGTKRPRGTQGTPQPHKAKPPTHLTVSLEQTEFAAVLSILLRSPLAPFHLEEYEVLSSAILARLHRFLYAFPSDSSLINEYLSMVSSTLSHVSFNKKPLVEKFAREGWSKLLSIWGVKDRRLKEELVAIFRTLLPFAANNMDDDGVNKSKTYAALQDLYNKLVSDADNKWGNECISLEAIRLEVASGAHGSQPFVAKTFCAGSNFDQGNTLGWAILQLHADVVAKLYELSENGSHQTQINKSGLDRNPLNSLLRNMIPSTTSSRPYRFQLLLFLVDRHWNRFHYGLKDEIINTLLQFISIDDSTIQSWVFLVLAAITFSENQEKHVKPNIPSVAQLLGGEIWSSIWTHAIRRVYIPNLCRAASHTAHVIILSLCDQSDPSSSALPPQHFLPDIESLVKDIYIQGPSYPYDSVCSFLSDCLTTASQDVRLYRMGFEDKVLSWLVDNWKGATASKDKLALNDIQDVLLLLQTVCGLRSKHTVKTRILIPECCISDQMSTEMKTEVIRDYVLEARLPQLKQQVVEQDLDSSTEQVAKVEMGLAPRSRERKVKAFFSRILETVLGEWSNENIYHTAEKARVAIDFAVVALIFEAQLITNGTESDRTVLKHSAKLISAVIPFVKGSSWSWSEKAMVLLGLEPLVSLDGCHSTSSPQTWTALVPPGTDSGIRSRVLEALRTDKGSKRSDNADILSVLWQHPDVQESFDATMTSIREILSGILQGDNDAMDIDTQDDFSMVGSAVSQQMVYSSQANDDAMHFLHYVAEACITFITTGPFLQSTSKDPVRDTLLTNLVHNTWKSRRKIFLMVSPLLFMQVKRKILHLTGRTLKDFLETFGLILQKDYEYMKSASLQTLVIGILDDVLDIWTSDISDIECARHNITVLYNWLAGLYVDMKMPSWMSRDAFAHFLANYIQREPTEETLAEVDEDLLPSVLLPKMNSDTDIRVRFRAAVLNVRLLEKANELQIDPVDMYDAIKRACGTDMDDYDSMITRFLCLGNVMINNSSVRRGAYWNLVEILCLKKTVYFNHIKAVLEGVAHRLGLPNLSTFCETFSTQLAWSLSDYNVGDTQELGSALFRFPHKLLGYKDARQCAEMTLRAFTPSYMVAGKYTFFEDHCLRSGRDTDTSLRDIFADIVGLQVLYGINNNTSADALESLLQEVTFEGDEFDENLRQNVDGVITYMLPTLFETPTSNGDPVVEALKSGSWDRKAADIFTSLLRYQDANTNYVPNLPYYSAHVVLSGILWLTKRLPDSVTPATTFHVLHELFARIHRSPFVNEQLRLTRAFCLWVAIQATHFKDGTLLYTLTHGAAALMAQSDLARSAQSILEWAFSCYRKYGITDTRLSSTLLRIACTAHDYSAGKGGDANMELGKSLMEWIDAQIVHFGETMSSKESLIHRALAAWPYELSPSLLGLCQGITSETLSKFLADSRISSEKFGLVRRLRQHKLSNTDNDSEYSFNFDFWKIKECIPSDDRMQIDDIDAFIALLELNYGQFSSFSTDQRGSDSIRDTHRLVSRRKTSSGTIIEEAPPARDCVISTLLKMLQRDMESQVYTAYNTLRLIMAAMPPDTGLSTRILPEQSKELEYLRVYRRFPRPSADLNILDKLEKNAYIESISDFPKWIRLISALLSDCLSVVDPVFGQLNEILGSDVIFAEDIFPVLVHQLLLDKNFGNKSASNRLALSRYVSSVLSAEDCDARCLRCIIDTVLHLRYFTPGNDKGALAYNNWLDVDYKLLAKCAAFSCGAYTTALLFLELAADQDSLPNNSSYEDILYKIYEHIDEPDGFYGIITEDLQKFLVKRLHHEQQWDKAFRFHGAVLEAGQSSADDADGLIRSFHSFGFHNLAIDTLQNTSKKTDNSGLPSSMTYRLGWRTETWDLPTQTQYTSGASIYQCLRAVYRERDQNTVDSTIRQALYREMSRLRDLGPENVIEIRQVTQDLMCIHQIYRWRDMEKSQPGKDQREFSSRLRNEFINIDSTFEFSDLENIMATRISLVRSAWQKEEKQQIGNLDTPFTRSLIDIEKLSLLRLSEAARKTNHVQIAFNAIVRVQELEKLKKKPPSFDTSHEFAHVLWLHKEEKLSVQCLLNLVKQHDHETASEISPLKKALLLSRLGSWSSDAHLNNATDIWDRYFGRAISLLESAVESAADQEAHAAVYHKCAIFASRQYHAIVKSPDGLRWKLYVQRKEQEIDNLQNTMPRASNLPSIISKAKKELDADKGMYTKYDVAKNTFLRQAIEMYSRCLHNSDKFDNDAAIRLCSLWFANFDDKEKILEATIPSALARIASRKMVFLAHQLTARLTKSESVNQTNLQTLIIRMCTDHPFHSLYQLYCLCPGGSVEGQRLSSVPIHMVERAKAAASIFARLRADSTCKQRVKDVIYLCNAYLQWAKYPIKNQPQYQKRKISGFKIPDNMMITKISNIQVPVSTRDTPVDPTMRYDNCVWIKEYESTFDTAGGVNIPKICVCLGTDGNKYKQLLKGEGNDDLRQDAVMEQVFGLVNTVLQQDRETKRRKLTIREYKVIPLNTQAGILEFVGNTTPLRSWLDKAHRRYRPKDWKPQDCSDKLRDCSRLGPGKQLSVFKEIQENFKPVMRHYFTEKHKGPISWFSMRLSYIRSVATTSIVGHILGLGDRHTSNILLDNSSGEVVHIDLGIAFDQGKLLPVPERVPFRMTADMVDGMGTSGTHGVFRRSAEETLRVLREGSEVIMTVLEVFKHDPLHSWVASDSKIMQAQNKALQEVKDLQVIDAEVAKLARPLGIGINMNSNSSEEAADRALSSVARKLDKTLTVETVVNELTAEATDINNLATIYFGWGPYY